MKKPKVTNSIGSSKPGRKPLADEKKEPITIYVKKSSVKKHGGKIALKELLTAVAESHAVRDAVATPKITPILPAEAVALHNAEFKDQFTDVFPGRQLHNGEILRQIGVIEAETIPKERDTYFGKKAWRADRDKRIEELKKQLK
jgi:hypothetical protein